MKLYLISGEDSGDMHGANLVKALRSKLSDLDVRGVGGDRLIAEGMETVAHVRDINFMGFAEVVRHLGTIRKLFRTVEADIEAWKPDVVVLVDYPGFNLRMAAFIKKLGIPVVYYISPQVWAWKKNRVKKIRRFVDKMLVILPFEANFYEKEGVEADFVGHPLLDEIGEVKRNKPGKPTIALLPGSRKQEIQRLLPAMRDLPTRFPDFRFVIAGAPSQTEEFYHNLLPSDSPIELQMNQTYALLREADYAVVASGTATLETALFQVPEVVIYRGSGLSVWLAKRLVKVPYISLVNLIMDRKLVTELIQRDCTPERIAQELQLMMQPAEREAMLSGYEELRIKLGDAGASENAAQSILKLIE